MAEELGFTSTPQGLDPSASGYCTVFRTPGVTKNLQFELEALSVYRPAFPPGSPGESQNPKNYSYQMIGDGRRRWHVVSRTAYAGADYTGRNNHFSHHVLLAGEELPANGPAWLASRSSFLEHAWNGKLEVLPAARSLPYDDGYGQPTVCRQWEASVGDAGWAGRLVEAYLEAPSLPCYLIYRPGEAILPLIKEALALLPPEQRWNVTFCTYYTSGGKGDCVWRGVLEGTPEAEQALRSSNRARVFDLRSPHLGPAPAGEWTEYARSGRPPTLASTVADNGGYRARGDGDNRTATVVVPKRRAAAPLEELPMVSRAVESAPAPETSLAPAAALAPPPPPPVPVRSLAMPLILVLALGLPVAMLLSGGLAWQIATQRERQKQKEMEGSLVGFAANQAADSGQKQQTAKKTIDQLQEQIEKDARTHAEELKRINQQLTDANDRAGRAEGELKDARTELNTLRSAKGNPTPPQSPPPPADAAGHKEERSEPVETEGLESADMRARRFIAHAQADEPPKPVYFLKGETKRFAARPEPRAVLYPKHRMQLIRPSTPSEAWRMVGSNKKDAGTLTRDGDTKHGHVWKYVPADELSADELADLKWLAVEFDDKIVCLTEKPNGGQFKHEKATSNQSQSTVGYPITFSALKPGDAPVELRELVPSGVRFDLDSSAPEFIPTEAEYLLDVNLGEHDVVELRPTRAGWTLKREGLKWTIFLPVAQKAMNQFENARLSEITLAYRVLRSVDGKSDSGAYNLPAGTWRPAPEAPRPAAAAGEPADPRIEVQANK